MSNQLMRILCVFSSLNRGGSESMCMNLYRHIDREKVQFDFVKHTKQKCVYEDEIDSLGGVIYEAPRLNSKNIISYYTWWKRFLIEHPEYTIIHVHFYTISAVIASVAHKTRRKVIGHCHSSFQVNSIARVFKKAILRLGGHLVDYRLACSEKAGRLMFGKKDFTVIKNAVDINSFCFDLNIRNKVRAELGILTNDTAVGTVGRFSPPKNIDGIIEIIHLLKKKNERIRFIWVGDGQLQLYAVSKIKELGLQDRVIFTGSRSDVNRLLQAMDLFILPSLWEGLPIVNIEAQAAGLPCFISDRVTKECDVTGRCVFLPIDNAEKWTDAIMNADLTRYDAREQIKEAGYDIIESSKWLENYYLSLKN